MEITRPDIAERIAVCEARINELRARIRNAADSQPMLAHASHLRQEAYMLLAQADRIEHGVWSDQLHQNEYRSELIDACLERDALVFARQAGINPRRLSRVIELLKKKRG